MATGGGTLNASNLTVNTSGVSSAAIRTDRGEGKNSVTINNCNLTDSSTKLNGLSTTFLYQSMSGDADTGNSEFTANNSTITTNNGDSFYITNTSSTIKLTNNTIINNDANENFLRAKADSWGNEGSNGGDVTLILNNQKAVGNIVIDSVSKLNMTMNTNSYYEGTINADNTANNIVLKLDNSSRIKLTGDSYITSLETEDSTYSNIDFNGYKLYVNGIAIN